MNQRSGRDREASMIRQVNRATAVGRLMLGQTRNWSEFLGPDQMDLTVLPRKRLKSGKADIKRRLSMELKEFCDKNFIGMTIQRLSDMYEDIKTARGIEMPLAEFESRFAPIRKEVLRGNPAHLTVSISLWGLQFKIPEDELAKDILKAVELTANVETHLKQFEGSSHTELQRNRDSIGSLIRQEMFAARSGVIACFNLMEAYLNGIAWDYLSTADTTGLSNSDKKLLEDSTSTPTRKKFWKYPEIICGSSPWNMEDADVAVFFDFIKPFRDSLVHPSPFAAPDRFGGYDKLRLLYRINKETVDLAAVTISKLLLKLHTHIKPDAPFPPWMEELRDKVEFKKIADERVGNG